MHRTKTILVSLLISTAALTADDAKSNEAAAHAGSDLFTEELRAARQFHTDWDARDTELDQARNGASLTNPEVYRKLRTQISAVLKVKRVELEAWSAYYAKTGEYWNSILKTIQTGQPSRSGERQDLSNMLAIERREYEDLKRRRADLTQTLGEKGVTAEQPAVADLGRLLKMKEDNIATIERAIAEFDLGTAHLDKRRDLARTRSLQVRQMLRSVEVERPLWEALYTGGLHRLDLEYDKGIPEPEGKPDWRKKLGGAR